MKVRDSGMPEREYWESLLDVKGILDALRVDQTLCDVVEIGCGYGTFTLPTAQRIGGTLHAFDIEPDMIALTRERLEHGKINNVRVSQRDVIAQGFDLPSGSVDAALLFNILHAEDPFQMLRTSASVLRPNGRLLAVHWRSDVATPRGPDLTIRPRPEQIESWAMEVGLRPESAAQIVPPWHFAVAFRRGSA